MRLWLISITFLAVVAGASSAPAAESQMSDVANGRWVEVSGEGSISAAPDFARVTLGVTSTGKTAGDAMAANAKAANALVSLVKAEGVAPADIQTSELSISPMFSEPVHGQDTAPTITGYSVSNNVAVTVREIVRLGALLDKAISAGANSIYGISFGHDNLSDLLDRARPLAVADARRKAEIYAAAGGAKLGRLMALTEDGGSRPPIAFSRAFAAGAPAPTPIEAGEDKLVLTVTTRFELKE